MYTNSFSENRIDELISFATKLLKAVPTDGSNVKEWTNDLPGLITIISEDHNIRTELKDLLPPSRVSTFQKALSYLDDYKLIHGYNPSLADKVRRHLSNIIDGLKDVKDRIKEEESPNKPNLPYGFVIMQIGNPELDNVYNSAIAPAIEACGLEPKRVDKHNKGGLLKSEIISFIKDSEIIIADLTNERPNCYLEIGYAMGIDKFNNLILTVREDHFPDSPNYKKDGPKVHFDLAGYDILPWHLDDIPAFRRELEKRIRYRQRIIRSVTVEETNPWDHEWIDDQRETALPGLKALNLPGFIEIRFALQPPKLDKSHQELNEAARLSTNNKWGWPIGDYYPTSEEGFHPKPKADGIVAEIPISGEDSSYIYWSIRTTGDFYTLHFLYEDQVRQNSLIIKERIIRVTEALLYCKSLYSHLGVDSSTIVHIAIQHGGLKDRFLLNAHPIGRPISSNCIEDKFEKETSVPLNQIESDLVDLVKHFTKPLFNLFEFKEVPDEVYKTTIKDFIRDYR